MFLSIISLFSNPISLSLYYNMLIGTCLLRKNKKHLQSSTVNAKTNSKITPLSCFAGLFIMDFALSIKFGTTDGFHLFTNIFSQ